MRRTLLILFLTALATAVTLSAQEEPPVADTSEQTEQPETPDPADATTAIVEELPEQPATTAEPDSGEPGLNSFTPSEEISADRSVAFPNDI